MISTIRGDIAMHTDVKGNKYYTAKEAMKELGVSRLTFDRRIANAGIKPLKRESDVRYYYRVEDIERLKQQAQEFKEVD